MPSVGRLDWSLFRCDRIEAELYLSILTRFLHANRIHPRIKSGGMLRWKALSWIETAQERVFTVRGNIVSLGTRAKSDG
jgi:hypothetical protein